MTSRQYAGQTVGANLSAVSRTIRAPDHFKFHRSERRVAGQSRPQIVFLALPHGVAAEFAVPLLKLGCRSSISAPISALRARRFTKSFTGTIIPRPICLRNRFTACRKFIATKSKQPSLIASPGCYPTSILLPLIPLLKAGLIKPTGIIADSLSGVSGAGRKAELDYLFVECNESVRPYGIPEAPASFGNRAGTFASPLESR